MKHLKFVPFIIALLISGIYILSIPDLPLGPMYDLLMKLRPRLEAPADLVVIDTTNLDGDPITSDDVVRLLITLSAMESRLAVFQTRVHLPDEHQSFSSTERQRLVQREFARIQKNIINLFDGIRLGSVRPQDAARYVQDVTGLVEESKNRLLLTIAESGNIRELELEKARALFNRIIVCDDLEWGRSAGSALEVWGGQAVYSSVDRDADGMLRRIYPVRELPNKQLVHAGMALLLYTIGGDATIEGSVNTLSIRNEKVQYVLPLDTRGRFLVHHTESYKTIPLKDILAYQEQEKKLYEALKEMERSGYFIHLDPLQYPTTLYEYTQSLEMEVLDSPLPDLLRQWREARKAFYKAVSEYLQGPAEQTILKGYDALLVTENLKEGGKERIASLKELVSQSFSWARKAYDELMVLYTQLESVLYNGYCIVGSTSGDAEASVALLSTILSRSFIYPGKPLYLFLANTVVLLVLFIMSTLFSPLWFFVFSVILAIICLFINAGLFVIGGYWYAPIIPVGIVLGSSLLYLLEQALLLLYMRRHQELALKYRMSQDAFKTHLRSIPLHDLAVVPKPVDIQEMEALILCVRHASFLGDGPSIPLKDFAQDVKVFRHKTAELIKSYGGTILWMDGEVLFAAFGFPHRASLPSWNPAREALTAAQNIVTTFSDEPVTVGIDYGISAFYFDVLSGYSALGRISIHARVLSGLAGRYQVRLLCSESAINYIQNHIDEPLGASFIDTLVDKQEQRDIRFFTIPYNGHSGL
ncbi:CHASE2 domain-containing protein [Gracilinema caldarium]|uniref:Uncharacterized protein n=1 Tax=Gracilinema caldarium (strain ATCC 51460 / DSM 7334 / H1) TaxID=744872 RepID=F8F4D8_GRAC1|nr:CHASE2 domain-containing protein [Gracilinema caldarium]AEJ20585.1 hypothetical protein Spica_2480 [Gracilinema caldarium DSM 7334]